jgi:hypothetical protein
MTGGCFRYFSTAPPTNRAMMAMTASASSTSASTFPFRETASAARVTLADSGSDIRSPRLRIQKKAPTPAAVMPA